MVSLKDIPQSPIKSFNITIDDYTNFDEFDNFTIKVNNEEFIFYAIGDCCSMSRFKVYKDKPFSTLIGKTLEKLEEVEFPDDYEYKTDSDDDICVLSHLYQFSFKDNSEPFQFLLINYSNGYYDGWIQIEKK